MAFWRPRRSAPASKKRGFGEDEAYFEDDGPETGPGNAPRRAPESSAPQSSAGDEADPLDAFMAGINAEITKPKAVATGSKSQVASPFYDLQTEDPVASYFEAFEKAAPKKKSSKPAAVDSDGDAIPQDEEDEEEGDRRNKKIEPLAPVDHSQIQYNKVQTEFYKPHEEVARMTDAEVTALRAELHIGSTGANIPSPVVSFGHLANSLGKELMEGIRRHGYHQPTAIQAQAIPAALMGRDIIGIAETGSGKTVAYLLPMLVHAIAQPVLQKDEGPIGIVLCPTRELAVQIETETYKFNKQLGLRSITLAGGLSKTEQFKEVKRGSEIAICNPGRLIDIVKMKGCNLRRCTIIILDEADRMFHMGFEYQVRSIVQNLRPSRQTLLFSATFPPKIEKLARDLLQQPIRITIGKVGGAASSVEQMVDVLTKDEQKWAWLSKRIDGFLEKGQVLIFVKSIASAEELTQNFTEFLGKKTEFLHGDLDQGERMRIISSYRKRKVDVLIATDIAARGLDIPSIAVVVSYDVARDIETHTHRVGRTGRAGALGQAYTLLINDDHNKKMGALLAENMEQAGSTVPDDLQVLATKYGPYRAAKLAGKTFEAKKKGKGGGKAVQSTFGLGFDGVAQQKETVQDLEKRLNREADQLMAINRAKMSGAGRDKLAALGRSTAGFVSAATDDTPPPPPKISDAGGDSDEDLFAPGVHSAFGRGSASSSRGVPPPDITGRGAALLQQAQAHQLLAMQQLQEQQMMTELSRMAATSVTGHIAPTGFSGGFSDRPSRSKRSRSKSRSRSRGRRRRRSSS